MLTECKFENEEGLMRCIDAHFANNNFKIANRKFTVEIYSDSIEIISRHNLSKDEFCNMVIEKIEELKNKTNNSN